MGNKTENITFLFGAGNSIKAGMPKTSDITNALLQKDLRLGTDGIYSLTFPPLNQRSIEKAKIVIDFMRILKEKIDCYYDREFGQEKFRANYEDIYYIANQIQEHLCGFPGNPLVDVFLRQIESEIVSMLQGGQILDLLNLTSEVMRCIKYIVCELLQKQPSDVEYLDFIKSAILKYSEDNIEIFTLNHDLVLETYFQKKDIQFVIYRFGEENNHAKRWDTFPMDLSGKVRFYKLHGSIDWKNLYLLNEWKQDNVLIPKSGFYDTSENVYADNNPPLILVGTTNKIIDYHRSVFVSLHNQFYQSLSNTDRLIVSGYCFRDRVINIRIINWIFELPQHKMIVIDPSAEGLLRNASVDLGLIENNPMKVAKISKEIEKCTWADIEEKL
jgi:hypothetical protein